jgi:hypothetical protein
LTGHEACLGEQIAEAVPAGVRGRADPGRVGGVERRALAGRGGAATRCLLGDGGELAGPVRRRGQGRHGPVATPARTAVSRRQSGGSAPSAKSSSSPWRRRRCSCGSGRRARSTSTPSLRRPRGPKSDTSRVGVEVRSTGRDPGTHLLAAARPAPRRRPSQRPMAGAEGRRGRGDRSQVRSGLAGLGAPQDRRNGARRRLRGVHLDRGTGAAPPRAAAAVRVPR